LLAGGTARHVFGDRRVSTVHPRVRDLGYVTDGQLRALYENAACLVQPSLYEGFGLPPLEAMACGCPVVASRAASLPEVCGDAAIYCDPHDPRDIARCIQEVLEPTLSKDLRARGARRAKQFTWRGAALETVALLKRLSVTASQMPSLPNT
jgi:glycosyltransferase involved in cell wall biosynthesis